MMKRIITAMLALLPFSVFSQTAENIIIITTDGFRWNEIFTGYPDTAINSNSYAPNPHTTLLEFLNKQERFKNKVAAFGAWNAFDRILNEERSKIPVYSAFDPTGGTNPTADEKMINAL